MFGQDREQLRRFYQQSWQKRCNGEPLEGLEALVAQIVEQHPEYHPLLIQENSLQQDFRVEDGNTNPFLHMGMHVTLAEALSTDRPSGIRGLYTKIAQKIGDPHQAEHKMMDCLGLILWEAQRANRAPDEQAFLACLKQLT